MSEHIIILAAFSHFPTFQVRNMPKYKNDLKVFLTFMSLDFAVPLSAQKVTIPFIQRKRKNFCCTQSVYNLTAPEHASNDAINKP